MEVKTYSKIFTVAQTTLAVIILTLITIWGVAHLCKRNFNIEGFGVYATVWYIIYRMTILSIKETKAEFRG